MGFFSRISNTWSLMGQSWQLLKQDKEMLIFPLLSGICCLLVIASYVVPVLNSEEGFLPPDSAAVSEGDAAYDQDTSYIAYESDSTQDQIIYYAKLFLFYLSCYLIIIFFNTAIVGCVSMRIHGHDPTIADGFKIAVSKLGLIIGWALVAATVGLILRIIEDKNRKVGAFIAAILGMAWAAISFLVLPIMVIENKKPFTALKESSVMLKKTWGDQLMGNFTFGMIFFLLGIPAFLLIFVGIMAQSIMITGICIAIGVVYLIAISLIQSALQVIFQTALYYYARDGQTVVGFDPVIMREAMYTR
ncbi:MAG: hypothetical protein KAS23_08100 [Anaerohalosphaera sp.]|nr:hypothetical protein [Anaerohalosphaera sp.]